MKPSIPKGTRDFLPAQVLKRKYIFSIIETVFQKYGYVPIETPTLENLSTLTGKYGEEGDRLLFKVLNNGDYLAKANQEALAAKDSTKLTSSIAKRGLRYDLTVPFARYVVMHQNDLQFPFKRYQIQPVWRGDRPQKGRYQEFYQCDVDVVGSKSLMYEAELIRIFDEVYSALDLNVEIKMNHRQILFGIAEVNGLQNQFMDMTVAIDKLDKIGEEGVINEFAKKGIETAIAENVIALLQLTSIDELEKKLAHSPAGVDGIQEIRKVYEYLSDQDIKNELTLDISLARGLSYYTGCIFEVKSKDVEIGSISGGGRYDDLTSVFGLKNVSGVGISFGAARIFDVMEELNGFPETLANTTKLLLVAFDEQAHLHAFKLASTLRKAGISTDIYPDPVKMKKQMKYAHEKGIPFVGIIGDQEMAEGVVALKDMETGEQEKLNVEALIEKFSS